MFRQGTWEEIELVETSRATSGVALPCTPLVRGLIRIVAVVSVDIIVIVTKERDKLDQNLSKKMKGTNLLDGGP